MPSTFPISNTSQNAPPNSVTSPGPTTGAVPTYSFSSEQLDVNRPDDTGTETQLVDTLPTTSEDINVHIEAEGSMIAGQEVWTIDVKFNNYTQKYPINPHMITQLCIEDDFLAWPLRGYLIINNFIEGWERAKESDYFYHIRSDGRDEIEIEIKPKDTGSVKNLDDKIWRLHDTFCIYDVEDLEAPNRSMKMKKVYFWNKKFQFLQEKTVEWSTATGTRIHTEAPDEPIAHASDYDRGMPTGEAVASLLYAAGYSEADIDFTNWDWGASRITYTAKADWTVWENLQYLLDHHISEQKNDICHFLWNRGEEKWQLIPMYKFYDKAGRGEPGELQREHLFFEDYVFTTKAGVEGPKGRAVVSPAGDPYKAPWLDKPQLKKDIKSLNVSTILSYKFTQPSGLDGSRGLLTRPVYSHWHKQKQFDVEAKENEIKFVREDHIKPNYIEDKLLYAEVYPVMPFNTTKTNEYAIDPMYSPVSTMSYEDNDRKIRSLSGKGKTLQTAIFQNQCMSVRMQGSTHREAGTFVGVDRVHEGSEYDYDYQLLGQYFVTNVKHIFQQQKYVTDIVMVKIHAYRALKDKEDIE